MIPASQSEHTHPRHERRTVEWGNWGLTFMEKQPDLTKNFGVIVGHVSFPIGTRGPVDIRRDYYREVCRAWVENGVRPLGLIEAEARPS